MSERAFLRLAAPLKPAQFVIRGFVPWEPERSGVSELVVSIDGVEKIRQALRQGEFKTSFELEPSTGTMRVDLATNASYLLGPQDAREGSILIRSIGWKRAEDNMD
jgi:hypothetical protein